MMPQGTLGREHLDTILVFSCDQTYFPLAKGLVLSLTERATLPFGVGLACIDIGCSPEGLAWFGEHGVQVTELLPSVVGEIADRSLKYHRAQACRPFLPSIFPDATVLIWIDCDAWVQDCSILAHLRQAALQSPLNLFACPEIHYTYDHVNDHDAREKEMFWYYSGIFGETIANSLYRRPVVNSGFFAMSRDCPIWRKWAEHIERIYLRDRMNYDAAQLHMAEQLAFNVVSAELGGVEFIDPIYNYISLWTHPFRDDDGVVRIAKSPHVPIGIVHLAGGWSRYGKSYFDAGLLYDTGKYLSQDERNALLAMTTMPERVAIY